jgi:hypothetical protein
MRSGRASRIGRLPRVVGWRRPPDQPRPWSSVGWRYSLIPVLAVGLLFATVAAKLGGATPTVGLSVTDAYTGLPLAGATVTMAGESFVSDAQGRLELDEPEEPLTVTVHLAGFADSAFQLAPDNPAVVNVALRPTTLSGVVTDVDTGRPLAGVDVAAVAPDDETRVSTETGADGRYELSDVPAGARLLLDGGDYGTHDEPIDNRTVVDLALELTILTGQIVDDQGKPVAGVTVRAGDEIGTTGRDGIFKLMNVSDGTDVVVTASGFVDQQVELPADRRLSLTLEPVRIKAIYANQFALADPDKVDYLIDLIDRTELNALVLDIKQDTIYYDSEVPFFVKADTVNPIYDLDAVLGELKEHGIYTIARMVVFQDPLVAEAYPELAVRDEVTGDLWRNYDGVAWVNAFNEELWHANVELALEAAARGFDEIQFDYVRFPSDGDLTTADFGREYTAEARAAAITGFVAMAAEAIRPTGAKLAADLFAIIALFGDDQGIGQLYVDLVPLLDYVCLMVYPSHFITGNIYSAPGHPNDYPYETVLETLQRAEELVPGSKLKARPWIQDFDYPGLADYGEAELRAQIDAAEDYGASGWMVWDPSTDYTVSAFDPD